MAELERAPASELPDHAAAHIANSLREAMRARGRATLAIPGGSATTPLPALRTLLGPDWSRVELTWVDERCVDHDDDNSNRGAVYRAGALSADDPPGYELPLWLDGESFESASARVEQALAERAPEGLDVALLGMGPDGHIASLFPGHRLLTTSSTARVQHITDSPKPPPERMTLSLDFLKKTRHSYLVALGESKREALQRVLDSDPSLPLSHFSNLRIFTDIDLRA